MELDADDLIRPPSREKQSYLSLSGTLTRFQELESATPRDIAQNRLQESPIRLHCRRLCRIGLLARQGSEFFAITPKGENSNKDEEDILETYLNYVNSRTFRHPRIIDLSHLDSYGVKEANASLLDAENQEYGLIERNRSKTERRIWNTKGTRIYRVLREFPLDEPLISQCAHWMRSFAGLHFFPDANHRTGMLLLQALLTQNGIDASELPGKYRNRAVLRSKLLRILHLDSITVTDLWKRDEYYRHWCSYFKLVLMNIRDDYRTETSLRKLRRSLKAARRKDRL